MSIRILGLAGVNLHKIHSVSFYVCRLRYTKGHTRLLYTCKQRCLRRDEEMSFSAAAGATCRSREEMILFELLFAEHKVTSHTNLHISPSP